MEFQIPKLRTDLQITPGYSEGKRAVVIKDSLGLIQEPVILEGETTTILVSGVDFSHIGLKFGRAEQASSLVYESEKHDKLLIKALCERDVEAFWAESRRVLDRYNVCGFSALASLLEILPRSYGHLVDYEIWREGPTQSAASFAAIAFEAK